MNTTLDRVKDQLFSGILERNHIDIIRVVIELIEEHNEEQVKYILGKMCLEMTQLSTSLKTIQGELELQQTLEQILPDKVKWLTITEHELLQMKIQLDEGQKENMIIKYTNTQVTDNFEDTKTLLAEIQLRMESSHVTDSLIVPGGETETTLKEKIESLKVELKELKSVKD